MKEGWRKVIVHGADKLAHSIKWGPMKLERPEKRTIQRAQRYEAESWRTDETSFAREAYLQNQFGQFETLIPDARERTRLFRLLGLINYRILAGNRIYIEVGGVVYRTLWGGYWRSVFTGAEHYLLKCQEVSGGVWVEGSDSLVMIDLPITNTKDGWAAQGHSINFALNRD